MREFFHRLAFAYGVAIILMFFSEYYFVNQDPVLELISNIKSNPILALPAFIAFSTFYVLFTYPLLISLSYFNIRTLSGLLLGGAFFGWATEGLTLPVIYEAIPVSFMFPSVSWHALIDVIIGFYFIRIFMRKFSLISNIILFIILGAIWGALATWYWDSSNAEIMQALSVSDFTILAIVASGFWLIGMFLADKFGQKQFIASKWELALIGVIYVILYIIIALPYLPLSMLIIALIGVTILALWRQKNSLKGQTILEKLNQERPSIWKYFSVLLTPIIAIFIYLVFYNANIKVPTDLIVQSLLLFGTIWFFYAIITGIFATQKH